MLSLRHEATTNTKLEAMQNTIKAVLEETKHLRTVQVDPPLQNVQVKQTIDKRHIDEHWRYHQEGKRTKLLILIEEDTSISFLIGLI